MASSQVSLKEIVNGYLQNINNVDITYLRNQPDNRNILIKIQQIIKNIDNGNFAKENYTEKEISNILEKTKEFQKKVDEYYRKKYTKELLNTKNKDYIKRNKVNTDFLKNPDYEFATIENLYDGIINNPKKIRQTNFE